MKRYKVSLPRFNFTVFKRGVNGTTTLNPPGSPSLATVYEMDALSEGDAVARFNEHLGIRSTTQEHLVELVSKTKPAPEASSELE